MQRFMDGDSDLLGLRIVCKVVETDDNVSRSRQHDGARTVAK
jgi:hypothetical protein